MLRTSSLSDGSCRKLGNVLSLPGNCRISDGNSRGPISLHFGDLFGTSRAIKMTMTYTPPLRRANLPQDASAKADGHQSEVPKLNRLKCHACQGILDEDMGVSKNTGTLDGENNGKPY